MRFKTATWLILHKTTSCVTVRVNLATGVCLINSTYYDSHKSRYGRRKSKVGRKW